MPGQTQNPGERHIQPDEPERPGNRRDPEERPCANKEERREKNLDKTLADSFPTSDPPSSIPDPAEDEAA